MAILVQSNKKPSVSFPTLTGSIVTFNSQYALPLKSCKVNIPVTQEGTGNPSPVNVRNFVGISSLDFTANSVVRTFQFGQTIYVCELDVLTGELKATHKLAIFDGSENWLKDGDNGRYLIPNWVAENSIISNIDHYQNICPTATTWAGLNNSNNACYFASSLIYKVNNSLYPTVEDFKNFLFQNNLQILYPLPTPEVINLGGMEIETLQGENNLFASTGDTTVQYIKIGG